MHRHLFCPTYLYVALILREPAKPGLISPVGLCHGLEELNGYCLRKAVHAISVVRGYHIHVSVYLQCRTDREDAFWWSIRLAQQAAPSLLFVGLEELSVLQAPPRMLAAPFGVR